MNRPATHRVTIDGTEYSYSGIIVEVSCEPTYATSHRWGWPDADGVMRCACGLRSDLDSHHEHACRIYAPRFSADRGRNHAFQSIDLDTDDVSPFAYDPDPVEAERQRCERLGVEWVGPDVQAPPSYEALLASGHSGDEIEQEFQRLADLHDLRFYWSQWRQEYDWDGQEYARRVRVRDRALAADEDRFESGGKHISVGYPSDGGIVRLGCELREADGVTARCLRLGMTKRMRGWLSRTHDSTSENGSWRLGNASPAFGRTCHMRTGSR